MPHVSANGAEVIRLPVPPISVQLQTVRGAAHLASMEATVARLCDELWRRPQDAARVLAELEAGAKAESSATMARDAAVSTSIRAAALLGTAGPEGAA